MIKDHFRKFFIYLNEFENEFEFSNIVKNMKETIFFSIFLFEFEVILVFLSWHVMFVKQKLYLIFVITQFHNEIP